MPPRPKSWKSRLGKPGRVLLAPQGSCITPDSSGELSAMLWALPGTFTVRDVSGTKVSYRCGENVFNNMKVHQIHENPMKI